MQKHDQVPETALAWHRDGRGVALATVVETWGSAPRAVGAQLAIGGDAALAGSVSGGCVEGAVAVEALEALEDGRCRLLEYGVSSDEAFAVGLACGGTIRVMVEPVGIGAGWDPALLERLVAERTARRAVGVLVQTAADGHAWTRRLVGPDAAPIAFGTERSGWTDAAHSAFLGLHMPPLRLAVVGAAHAAQPLALMAEAAGYDVTVIDPREAFATADRFPDIALSHDWPDAALAAHGLDRRTAVVTLSHDPKIDEPALMVALASEAFYVGALGSTRTHAKRAERLRAAGLDSTTIDRLDAPLGLPIGARTPAEIAISALAQMTERLRKPETRPGRLRGAEALAAALP
ncbi:MAG: XdhC/CoxI family protein [Pseudomonadota bacterium]